jgi:4-amino-4-deoxychorismate lyase
MSQLLETIRIEHRKPCNLERHAARMNASRAALFGEQDHIDLRSALRIPESLDDGIYKCRVLYDRAIHSVEFLRYEERVVRTLQLVDADHIRYDYKYADRTAIEALKKSSSADEIIIVKNNRITDASFANLVLYDGKTWLTPALPLLKGIRRQILLDNGRIREADIWKRDLYQFDTIALINAMLDLDEARAIPIESVFEK